LRDAPQNVFVRTHTHTYTHTCTDVHVLGTRTQSIKVLQQDLEEAEKQVDLMTQRIEGNKAEMARLQRCEARSAWDLGVGFGVRAAVVPGLARLI